MVILSIYTDKYDSEEHIVNGGMSGKAFLDMDNDLGFSFNSIDEALEYTITNNIVVDRIDINYLTNDGQMFCKFKVQNQ